MTEKQKNKCSFDACCPIALSPRYFSALSASLCLRPCLALFALAKPLSLYSSRSGHDTAFRPHITKPWAMSSSRRPSPCSALPLSSSCCDVMPGGGRSASTDLPGMIILCSWRGCVNTLLSYRWRSAAFAFSSRTVVTAFVVAPSYRPCIHTSSRKTEAFC